MTFPASVGCGSHASSVVHGPQRALYEAMSNTLAGVRMLAAGALTGLLARFRGHEGVLTALAGAASTL